MNPGPPPCKGGVLTRLDDGPAQAHGDSEDRRDGDDGATRIL